MSNAPIFIIPGTNRLNSLSATVAHCYAEILQEQVKFTRTVDLTALPLDFLFTALYENMGKSQAFNDLIAGMEKAEKYIFVVPDYNGSFPGIFKLFIDALDTRKIFAGKKCALVGVSKGIRGGIYGLSHLTDIFHSVHMEVYPQKLAFGQISDTSLTTFLKHTTYVQLLREQAKGFLAY